MVSLLKIVVDPQIDTGLSSTFKYRVFQFSAQNSTQFPADRSCIVEFLRDLVARNKDKKIYYSFDAPSVSPRRRSLSDEVSVSFSFFLTFAEHAVRKNMPLYIFSEESSLHLADGKANRANLKFSDFDNIFAPKLDLQSTRELKQKLRAVGHFMDVSYPIESKTSKDGNKNLNFPGHLIVQSVSSESIVGHLAEGSSLVMPNGSGEYMMLRMVPQPRSNMNARDCDDFGITWRTQTDDSFSCYKVRVPIVVISNELFYSNRGADFISVFKEELKELNKKNEPSVSSNPFHNMSEKSDRQKKSMTTQGACAPLEDDDWIIDEALWKSALAAGKKNSNAAESPSVVVAPAKKKNENQDSDSDTSVNPKQLTSFLDQFKKEMKKDLAGMVEEIVKNMTAKNGTGQVSSSGEDPKARPVINVNDCVKSEADNSDLPKLLSTLSQIEEQLSSIDNAVTSDASPVKRHYRDHSYAMAHGNHRRGRDFNSLTRRAALSILKKRVKGSVVELEPDLLAISKSGFRVKMARNVPYTFRFVLFKYGKVRNSKFEVEFVPYVTPVGGLECCVKPVTKSAEKSPDDRGLYSFYDVRFKSKDRIGKFRCFLKILRNGKVCGHPLCITVRVRRFCTNPDFIDFAEEAVHGFSGKDSRSRFVKMPNADIDEGISGVVEYPSSVSSDSDEGGPNRENDNDEGIDLEHAVPLSAFEKLKISQKFKMDENQSPFSNFDDDSDSSVSLLLDENEVREVVNNELRTVKIPPCFIPDADMSQEVVSVRVKRKSNAVQGNKVDDVTQSEAIPETLVATEGESACASKSGIKSDNTSPKSAHSSSSEDVKESKVLSEAECASKKPYRSLYPHIDAWLDPFCNEARSTPEKNKTAPKGSRSHVAILPEKVFEMTSNVFKSVINTMKQPGDMKDNVQKIVDDLAGLSDPFICESKSSYQPQPSCASQQTETLTNAVPPESAPAASSNAQCAWAFPNDPVGAPSQIPSSPSPDVVASKSRTPDSSSPLTATPAPEHLPTSASVGTNTIDNAHIILVPAHSARGSPQPTDSTSYATASTSSANLPREPEVGPPAAGGIEYNRLSWNVREQILLLNEMGFGNDSYNLFLINKYPNDISKVIECLLNFNDF